MQELIEWCFYNSTNETNQAGVELVVIDFSELEKQFRGFCEKERAQIVDAFSNGFIEASGETSKINGIDYYNQTFNNQP